MDSSTTVQYIGRHRSPHRRPAPLPMANLDGLLDAAVTVHLGAGDPYVMLTSDHDQAVVTLTPKQVERILGSAQRALEVPSLREDTVGPDFDPTDAELEQAWNGPDAPAAHKAAWALHQEMHDRSAS